MILLVDDDAAIRDVLSNEMPVGDTSTLANPEVVEQIREMVLLQD